MLGCKHYVHSCKNLAPCCNKWFACRRCHDAVSDHVMDRFKVERLMCMVCWTEQPFGPRCISPKCKMAPAFARTCCHKCRLLTHQEAFHCDACGVCRVGRQEDFQHCATCDVCMQRSSFERHQCIPGSHSGDCPICFETMSAGRSPDAVVVSLCGHPMHEKCLARYIEFDNFKCPLCSKLLGDMTKQFQELRDLMLAQPMPPAYRGAVSHIRCICCGVKSKARYHFLGHECASCKSFNTQVLGTDGLPSIEATGLEAMDTSS